MPAIVENNEIPDEEPRRGNGETERYPVGNLESEVHQTEYGKVWNDGICDLPEATSEAWDFVLRNDLSPGAPDVA